MEFSQLGKYEWLGQFWTEKDEKFPGIFKYSPKNGIKLITLESCSKIKKGKTGEPFTIYGYTHEAGCLSIRCLMSNQKSKKYPAGSKKIEYLCDRVVIGGHFSEESKFTSAYCKFNNLNEFCHPQDSGLLDEYNDKRILESNIEFNDVKYEIFLDKEGVGVGSALNLLNTLFLKKVKPNKRELIEWDFLQLLEKYDIEESSIIKEINYTFNIKPKETDGVVQGEYFHILFSIKQFLSLIMLKSIFPVITKVFSE